MVGTNKTHEQIKIKDDKKGFKRGNLKPKPEKIINDDQLLTALDKRDFKTIEIFLQNACFLIEENNFPKFKKQYDDILLTYSKNDLDQFSDLINKLDNGKLKEALMVFHFSYSTMFTNTQNKFIESINNNDEKTFLDLLNKYEDQLVNMTHDEFHEFGFMNGRKDIGTKNITPLMIVIEKGNMKMFNELMKRNADLLIKNSNGNTALSIAVHYQRFDMLKVLSEKLEKIIPTLKPEIAKQKK